MLDRRVLYEAECTPKPKLRISENLRHAEEQWVLPSYACLDVLKLLLMGRQRLTTPSSRGPPCYALQCCQAMVARWPGRLSKRAPCQHMEY